MIQIFLACLEGVSLAFSPCILPILPLILATTITGDRSRSRPFWIVTGFVFSFSFFALMARQLLRISGLQFDQVQYVAYWLLVGFGLILCVPHLERLFASGTNAFANWGQRASGYSFRNPHLGALWIGVLLGIIWTPCAGPILSVALLQVIQANTTLEAACIIIAFSIGASMPMYLLGYYSQQLVGTVAFLSRHTTQLRHGMGILIITFALMGIWGFNFGAWLVTPKPISAQTSGGQALLLALPHAYPAPELQGISTWINTPPLSLKTLRGHVVLIDFWTYSCINCVRTIPYLEKWYQQYHSKNLIIIGIHAPEFSFEAQPKNVLHATQQLKISYPVALDNSLATWKAYQNHYWPAQYLINPEGQVVYTHFGEGGETVTENNIRYLLRLTKQPPLSDTAPAYYQNQTPELYLGSERATAEITGDKILLHTWKLTGDWQKKPQYIESAGPNATLQLHYHAKKVFLVASAADAHDRVITVIQDHKAPTLISITHPGLYEIVQQAEASDGQVTIRANAAGVRCYSFTFG